MKTSDANRLGSDLRELGRILRERSRLIVLVTLAAVLLGVAHLVHAPKSYEVQATLQVSQEATRLLKDETTPGEDLKSLEVLATMAQNLTSPDLLVRTIRRNGLDRNPCFLPAVKRPASDNQLQEALAEQVNAKVRRGTRLIDLKVKDRDPAMARQIAEAIITEFLQETLQFQERNGLATRDYLVREADRLKKRLSASEQKLQDYREQHRAVALEERENIDAEKLRELNSRLAEARSVRLRLEADQALIRELTTKDPERLYAIASVAGSEPVVALKRTIAEKEALVATMQERYRRGHPKYLSALGELRKLQAGLDEAILKGVRTIAASYEAALATEKKLQKMFEAQEDHALELSKVSIPYGILKRDVDSDRALYESVLNRLKEIDVSLGFAQNAIRVVSPPMLPDKPSSPRPARTMALALLGGLMAGAGFAVLGRAMDGSARVPQEVERRLGIPLLSVVPCCVSRRKANRCLPVLHQPDSPAAEAFRTLRMSLSLLAGMNEHRTIAFTSAVPGEGKTFCSVNCAVAFAQQGLRTLLIDADLRRPSISKLFPCNGPHPGIAEVLNGEASLKEAIQPTGVLKLEVLCSHGAVPRPAELLAEGEISKLLQEGLILFDRIVVDTAPVEAVSDTLLLARHLPAVCLVIRGGKTSMGLALGSSRRLSKVGNAPIGFVFNGAEPVGEHVYHDYYRAGYASTGQFAAE